MSSPGRKLARQVQRATPEAREQAKQEQADKKAAALQPDGKARPLLSGGYKPLNQVRQRRSGNA